MTIKTQQKMPGAITSCAPAATSIGDQYILAWTNNDDDSSDQKATISWAAVSLDPAYNLNIITGNAKTGHTTEAGFGPALTTFQGTAWMAFLQNQALAPPIPPYDQSNQPPVILVSSLSGTKWSKAEPLWDPGLLGRDLYVPGDQGPAAITSPAIAANDSEILVVWVEYAVNGSDALAILSEGQPIETAQPQIFFSKSTAAGGWTQRSAVKHALTQTTPALVAVDEVFYMAWQGATDSNIYFAKYTDKKGWSATAKLPVFETSSGPALGVDDSGTVQLVWKSKSDSKLYLATLKANTDWSPDDPGKGWSSSRQLPVIGTSQQPALASQLNTSDVLLAYTGATKADLWVVPLSAFDIVVPPPNWLSGQTNYILANYPVTLNDSHNCPSLLTLSVTIDITEDIVLVSDSPPTNGGAQLQGFGFQLNCYSPPGSSSAWQQYVIVLMGNELQGGIDNWPLSGPNLYNTDFFSLAPVPNPNILPKGYKLNISLVIGGDAIFTGGIVTGAVYNVWDNHGNLLISSPQQIALPAAGVAPIIAFELNIVGPGNGEAAVLSSGAGTITYSTLDSLFAMISEPACAESGYITGENANTVYGELTVYPSNTIQQPFNVVAPGTPQAHKKGKIRPSSVKL